MTAQFVVGGQVRVRSAYPPGHVRTPYYCRGKIGRIVQVCGAFANPEQLAYGSYDARRIPTYRVRFRQTNLWADYSGSDIDHVELEIFEHWLEPAEPGASS